MKAILLNLMKNFRLRQFLEYIVNLWSRIWRPIRKCQSTKTPALDLGAWDTEAAIFLLQHPQLYRKFRTALLLRQPHQRELTHIAEEEKETICLKKVVLIVEMKLAGEKIIFMSKPALTKSWTYLHLRIVVI